MQDMIVDFETYSEVDVRDVGSVRYAEDPSTEVICMSWGLRGVPARLWVPPNPFPEEVADHVRAGGYLEAHHAGFERAVWKHVLNDRMGVDVRPIRWKDTMAAAAYRGLPLGLDAVGDALDLPVKKDKRGKYLLQRLSKPRKPTKTDPRTRVQDWDLTSELYDYCLQDKEAEDVLGSTIGDLPVAEQRIWVLDQVINQRGVQLDVEAVRAALSVVDLVESTLREELSWITDGRVTSGNQVKEIRAWLDERGVSLPDLQKATVETWLQRLRELGDPETTDQIRVLEIRQQLSRASTSKLRTMLRCVCSDGKLRGLLQYHGASTGRWAGRLVQPHNFPRGTIKDMDSLVGVILLGGADARDALTLLYDDPMEAVSSALRGMLTASPGCRLIVVDFAAIEARVVMWVAGQWDVVKAFQDYDRGIGPDIYCVMAEKIFGHPVSKADNPEERGAGKVTILGCGYQMSGARLQQQAWDDYGIRLTLEESEHMVRVYRSDHYMVVSLWYGLQEAAGTAIENPGQAYSYGRITYRVVEDAAGRWLECILPSGRSIWYYDPEVEIEYWNGRRSHRISYMGKDSKRQGRWGRIDTYGGMLTENVVQAIARDIMVEGMISVERAGYPLVLTVHDELVADVPVEHGTLREFETLVAQSPPWAEDCPIAVEGWEGHRYRKG